MRRQEESLGIAKETNMLNQSFTALLIRNPTPGGWTCVIWLKSAAFFETHKLVKVKGTIDGCPFRSAFMARRDGNHNLPVEAEILRRSENRQSKWSGSLQERINPVRRLRNQN
jgi:hypothetical protein